MPKNSQEPPDLPLGACTWQKITPTTWQAVDTENPVRRFEEVPPKYVWSEKDAAFVFDGKVLSNDESRDVVDQLVDLAIARSAALTEKLEKDEDVDGWFLALLALLSATALAAGSIAAGGRARVVGAVKDAIDRAIQYQTDFLRRWAGRLTDQVAAGKPIVAPTSPEVAPDTPDPDQPTGPGLPVPDSENTGGGGAGLGGGAVPLGKEPQTLPEMAARAAMYVTAAVGIYEAVRRTVLRDDGRIRWERRVRQASNSCASCRVYEAAGWVRIGTLPGIGQACECHSNCRCRFDYSSSIARP